MTRKQKFTGDLVADFPKFLLGEGPINLTPEYREKLMKRRIARERKLKKSQAKPLSS